MYFPLSPSQTWKRMLRKTGDRSGSGSMPDRATRSGGNFCEKSVSSVLFCGRGAGRGKAGRRTFAVVEPWRGFKRWTRGRDPPGIGSDDRPDTAWLSRRLHSAIVQAAHTAAHSIVQAAHTSSSSMAALLIRDGHA